MYVKMVGENTETVFRICSPGKVNGKTEWDEEGHKWWDRRGKSMYNWKDIILLDIKTLK